MIKVNPEKYRYNWPPFTGSFPTAKIWGLGVNNRSEVGNGQWFHLSPKFYCWVGVGFPYEPVHLRTTFTTKKDAKCWLNRFIFKWNSLHGVNL